MFNNARSSPGRPALHFGSRLTWRQAQTDEHTKNAAERGRCILLLFGRGVFACPGIILLARPVASGGRNILFRCAAISPGLRPVLPWGIRGGGRTGLDDGCDTAAGSAQGAASPRLQGTDDRPILVHRCPCLDTRTWRVHAGETRAKPVVSPGAAKQRGSAQALGHKRRSGCDHCQSRSRSRGLSAG